MAQLDSVPWGWGPGYTRFRFRKREEHMGTRTAFAAIATISLAAGAASAAPHIFAGFEFYQANATDTLGLLGNSANLGGAVFSANYANNITQSVGFVAELGNASSGFTAITDFDASRSLGRQANSQLGLTQPDGTSSVYASAVNLPRGNNGAVNRHGLEMSWSGNRALANGADADFLVYESASSSGGYEAFMIRGRDASTGEWSDWYYQAADSFEAYLAGNGSGAHAYAFDMSDLGFADGDLVDAIQLANLRSGDTIDTDRGGSSTAGFVNFDGDGVAAQWFNGLTAGNYAGDAYDPDPLYAVALGDLVTMGNMIPLPTGGAMGLAGLLVVGARRRRSA